MSHYLSATDWDNSVLAQAGVALQSKQILRYWLNAISYILLWFIHLDGELAMG